MNVAGPVLDGIGNNVVGEFDNRRLLRQADKILDILVIIDGFIFRDDLEEGINLGSILDAGLNVVRVKPLDRLLHLCLRGNGDTNIEVGDETQVIDDILLQGISHCNNKLFPLFGDRDDHGGLDEAAWNGLENILGYPDILKMHELNIQLGGKGLGDVNIIRHPHLDEQLPDLGPGIALPPLNFECPGKCFFVHQASGQKICAKLLVPAHRFHLRNTITHIFT